jgi:hypothetical protein
MKILQHNDPHKFKWRWIKNQFEHKHCKHFTLMNGHNINKIVNRSQPCDLIMTDILQLVTKSDGLEIHDFYNGQRFLFLLSWLLYYYVKVWIIIVHLYVILKAMKPLVTMFYSWFYILYSLYSFFLNHIFL